MNILQPKTHLYEVLPSGVDQFIQSIGSVDFKEGIIKTDAVTISGLYDDGFWFDIFVSSYDVIPLRDTIMKIDYQDCEVLTYVDYDKVQ